MTFDMHFALKDQNAITSEDCCRNAERFSSMKLIKDIILLNINRKKLYHFYRKGM